MTQGRCLDTVHFLKRRPAVRSLKRRSESFARSQMEALQSQTKMSLPSPKSPEQTDKSRKYDRQLRLWGEHGQQLLEAANICLVNATAVGCEVLKSLVLPGVGGFTIADPTLVTEEDLGINFFLNPSSVGQSKAAACMQGLQELNGDVHGDFVDESVDYILANRPAFFESFDLLVASNMKEDSLRQLSEFLWKANIPFLYCRSLGLYGSVRLQFNEHCVVEVHPDNPHYDYRLERPFPALANYLSDTQITHKQPWLLVLNKYLQEWRGTHDGRIPANYREKSELRDIIETAVNLSAITPSSSHDNHLEAMRGVNTVFGGGVVSSSLAEIFNDPCCLNLSKQSDPFWITVRALKEFVENENGGMLPLAGILPDMTAATESYIQLQGIYRQQALLDAEAVYRNCQALLKRLGLPNDTISERHVALLCREACTLHVVRGSKLADEYRKDTHLPILAGESELQGSLTELYIGLRSYERFQIDFGSKPGECYAENDTARLKSISNKLLSDLGVHTSMSDDLIHEICRYGGAEIHTVSAVIGGCGAHEAIKMLTKQYKPLDNTFLYNGITNESATMKI